MPRLFLDIVLGALVGLGLLFLLKDGATAPEQPAANKLADAFQQQLIQQLSDTRHHAYEQRQLMNGLFLVDTARDGPGMYDFPTGNDKLAEKIYFDQDGDGIPNLTGWVMPDELILVRDLNNNGKIDTRGEIFADPENPGLATLHALDENGDSVLDAQDAGFATLWAWHDIDRNATSDISELQTLAEAGISAIRFKAAPTKAPGLPAREVAVAEMTGGDPLPVYQAFLYYHTRVTAETTDDDWMLHDPDNLIGNFAKAPPLKGQGHMLRLFAAMRNSPAVYDAVGTVLATHPADYGAFMDAVQNLLFTWTGTKDIPINARGPYIDARKLATIEVAMGTKMTFTPGNSPNPSKFSKNFALKKWWQTYNDYACPFFFNAAGLDHKYPNDLIPIAALHSNMAETLINAIYDGKADSRFMMRRMSALRLADKSLLELVRPRAGQTEAERAGYMSFVLKCIEHVRDNYTYTNLPMSKQPGKKEWEKYINDVVAAANSPYDRKTLEGYQYYRDALDAPEENAAFIDRFFYFAQNGENGAFRSYILIAAGLGLFFILRSLGNRFIAPAQTQQAQGSSDGPEIKE